MKNRYQKLAGILETGEEPRERFHAMLNTRLETDFALKDLFESVPRTQQINRKLLEALFYQTPAAVTMAPSLQRQLPVEQAEPKEPGPTLAGLQVNQAKTKKASVKDKTSAVERFFEEHGQFRTEAQRRFPELLKVAADPQKVPSLVRKATKTTGALPRQSSLSGGSA